jgi:hypothetical protein
MIHYATANITACGKSTSNSSFNMDGQGEFAHHWCEQMTNRHTSDPDFVTCEDCKNSLEYKKARSVE